MNGIVKALLLLVCAIVGIWMAYQCLWKNEDMRGNKLKHNVLGILTGKDPVPGYTLSDPTTKKKVHHG